MGKRRADMTPEELEKRRSISRKSQAKRRSKNRDEYNKLAREWNKKNREKVRLANNAWRIKYPERAKKHDIEKYKKNRTRYLDQARSRYLEPQLMSFIADLEKGGQE